MSEKPRYDIVSPIGDAVQSARLAQASDKGIAPAAPLDSLASKKIGFIWTKFRNGDLLLEAFADILGKRFAGMQFVKLPSGKNLPWGDYPDRSFAQVVSDHKIDGLIAAPAC